MLTAVIDGLLFSMEPCVCAVRGCGGRIEQVQVHTHTSPPLCVSVCLVVVVVVVGCLGAEKPWDRVVVVGG